MILPYDKVPPLFIHLVHTGQKTMTQPKSDSSPFILHPVSIPN